MEVVEVKQIQGGVTAQVALEQAALAAAVALALALARMELSLSATRSHNKDQPS